MVGQRRDQADDRSGNPEGYRDQVGMRKAEADAHAGEAVNLGSRA